MEAKVSDDSFDLYSQYCRFLSPMSFLCHHPDQIWCATHIHFAFLKTALKIICSFPWIHSQRDRNICASFLLYYILAIAMTAALRFERTNLDLGIERIPGGRHRQLVRFIHPEVELRKRRGPIYQQGAENAGEQQASTGSIRIQSVGAH